MYSKESNNRYYQKNKEELNRKRKEYAKEIRDWYSKLKSNLKCSECGESHPAALSFHHKDPSTKSKDVSRMIGNKSSKKTIEQEINKCIVLCHNCHAILHYKDKNGES